MYWRENPILYFTMYLSGILYGIGNKCDDDSQAEIF